MDEHTAACRGTSDRRTGATSTPTAVVLYVGGDASLPRRLEAALDGPEVVRATTVDAALETIDSRPVDCVAGAGQLPGADGAELLEAIRQRHRDLPFVLVTAGDPGSIAGEAINAGADGYVSLREAGIEGVAERIEATMERRRHRETEARLDGVEAAVTHAADAIFVTDAEGTIEYVNPAFEQVTGYSRSEAVGRTPRILKSGEQDESYYERMWDAILDGEIWEEEILNRTRSDERYVAHQTVAPVTDSDGTVEKFVAVQRDVTEHRRFESQIAASKDALSELYDTSFDAGTAIEARLGRVLAIGSDHLGHPVGYVTRIEDGTQEILAAVGPNDRIEAGATDRIEHTYCRKTVEGDGQLVIGDAAADGWDDDPAFERFGLQCYLGAEIRVDGEVFGTLCFGGDRARDRAILDLQVSTVKTLARRVGYEIERHRYERTLERQNERLEKFASAISHDLRNPLGIAQARLELARDTGDDEHFDPIVEAHDRMESIIEDTLTLAREGDFVTDVSPVSLEVVATDCWSCVETGAATLPVDGDVELRADPDRLRHVFENLFRNAVEHGAEEWGAVTVTVGPSDEGFYVADDGTGIPPDKCDRVFEQGYTDGDGTGFGLAIVEAVARAHGWSVAVTESRDGGARFEFAVDDGDIHTDSPFL